MKLLPSDVNIEQIVLGSMLINFKCIPHVKKIITPIDFYKEGHQHICSGIFVLQNESDMHTLCNYLKSQKVLDKVGGLDYIAGLIENTLTSAGIIAHCEILKELSMRRQLIQACQNTSEAAYHPEIELEASLSDHKIEIKHIMANTQAGAEFIDADTAIGEVFDDIQRRAQSETYQIGPLTGFAEIDSRMSGLEPKTVTCIAARPSIGKTALSLNIADNIAKDDKQNKVLFFSLESNAMALTRRRLSTYSNVALTRIRTGNIKDAYSMERLTEAANTLPRNLILIENAKYKVVENLTSFAEYMAMESDISLIIIDHIQRMRSNKRKNNRHLEISWISEEISTLAMNLNVPIIILSQLSRGEKGKDNRKPVLSDLKESGDLEQNMDSVWGLWRKDKDSDTMRVEGLKGRDTGTWLAWLSFDRFIQKFTDCLDPPDDMEDNVVVLPR